MSTVPRESMFARLGRTIVFFRNEIGKSQADLAREAGIGKSQLSKYENGKELPKLDSLEKVLNALGVNSLFFFFTMAMADWHGAVVKSGDKSSRGGLRTFLRLPFLDSTTEEAFAEVFEDLLNLHASLLKAMFSARLRRAKAGPTAEEEGEKGEEVASCGRESIWQR